MNLLVCNQSVGCILYVDSILLVGHGVVGCVVEMELYPELQSALLKE